VGGHDTRLESEQESQQNQRSTSTTPAPVLDLRTASYCTENEGTPSTAEFVGLRLIIARLAAPLQLQAAMHRIKSP